MSAPCYDCPRACGVDRERATGFCRCGKNARIAKVVEPFTYEEPCLDELAAVFFSGCNLGCSYCQNIAISRDAVGKEYGGAELAALFDGIDYKLGLDLVTPTPHLGAIERAFGICKKPRRVVYNTSGYETPEAIARASVFTDVFLTDFKYGDERTAARFSHAPDYVDRALAALAVMRKTPDEWTAKPAFVLKRGLIVRHLVLPGHVENSIKVLDIIASALGTDTVVSVMSQFTPNGRGEPSVKLKPIEYKIVVEHALKLGFRNGYFQDMESAESKYTPYFGC